MKTQRIAAGIGLALVLLAGQTVFAGDKVEMKPDCTRPTYTVHRAASPITLDGKLDEPAWKAVPDMGPFHFTWWKKGKKMQTSAKMLWDDKYLYIGHVCEDEHITARYKNHDDPVPKDDCFELMIAPDPDAPNVYFNIEWNVLGAYVDGHRLRGSKKPWDAKGLRIAATYDGTLNQDADKDRSWTGEVAIPLGNFAKHLKHFPPRPGDRSNINFNRHGGDTNMQYSQWSKADTPTPAFHTPHRFGQIIFSPANDDR